MPSTSLEQKQNVVVDAPMYQPVITPNFEIDLINIIRILWRAKKTIIAVTVAFAIVGLAVAFILPQKWTSKAVITTPEDNQLIDMRRMMISLQVLGVDTKFDSDNSFASFIKKFTSQSLLEDYLENSPIIQSKFQDTKINQQELTTAINLISEKMKAASNNGPKNSDNMPYLSWTLSFSAPKAKEAQDILKGYISYISKLVTDETISDIRNAVELKISLEKSKLQVDRNTLTNEHNIAIERLNYSLQVANAAGIKRPVYSNGQAVKDDPDFSISLGADGIAQKLQIEKSLTDVAKLSPGIQNRETHVAELEKLNIKEVKFQPFKYQMTPSLPIRKDSAGKSIVMIFASVLGFILICGIVLIRNISSTSKEFKN